VFPIGRVLIEKANGAYNRIKIRKMFDEKSSLVKFLQQIFRNLRMINIRADIQKTRLRVPLGNRSLCVSSCF
jgi:hypothetical protein